MENNIPVTPENDIHPVNAPALNPTNLPVQKKKNNKKIVLFLLVFILMFLIVLGVIYIWKTSNLKTNLVDKPAVSLTPIPKASSEGKGIYTVSENGLEKIIPLLKNETVMGSDDNYFYTSSNKHIFKYSISSREKNEIAVLDELKENEKYGFVEVDGDHMFYTIDTFDNPEYDLNWDLYKLNLKTNEKTFISKLKPGIYTHPQYLFTASDGSEIIAIVGGDGCGGQYYIYKIVNKSPVSVEDMLYGAIMIMKDF